MIYRLIQTPSRILRRVLSVSLEGLCERVGGIVGFREFGGLEGGGFLEALARFDAGFLHAECVGGLGIEVYCCFVLFRLTAEEGEAAAGGGSLFVGLGDKGLACFRQYVAACWSNLLKEGAGVLRHVSGSLLGSRYRFARFGVRSFERLSCACDFGQIFT